MEIWYYNSLLIETTSKRRTRRWIKHKEDHKTETPPRPRSGRGNLLVLARSQESQENRVAFRLGTNRVRNRVQVDRNDDSRRQADRSGRCSIKSVRVPDIGKC